MTKLLDFWPAATSRALTVHSKTVSPLAQHQGTTLPIGAIAPTGTGVPIAGFRASGVDVQAKVRPMAVSGANRLTDVPGVPPRGAPV